METGDLLREVAPFAVGTLLPGVVLLAARPGWTGLGRFMCTLIASLILGACTSALAGELRPDLDSVLFVLIDTSLVFTASQVAFRFVWRPVLAQSWRRVEGRATVTEM